MPSLPRLLARVFLLLACAPAFAQAQSESISAHSPNRRNELRLNIANGAVTYEVLRDGKPLINPSSIRPILASPPLTPVVAIKEQSRETINETSPLPWGKSSTLRDHAESVLVEVQSEQHSWQLDLRAYDDGVAFRYRVPAPAQEQALTLLREETEFRPSGEPRIHFNTLDNFRTSHESLYDSKPLSELPTSRLIDCPMLIVWPEAAAAITEARVRHFAGMYLERSLPDATTLRTRLSPRLDHQETAVTAVGRLESPWRVVLLADNAGKLLESNLLLCLNDPPQGDFTWLKPGKTTFHWWNGDFEQDFGRADLTKVFVDRHKKYIDFCARHGIAYHGLSGDGRAWYPQSSPDYGVPSDDADVTAARPELDLPAILAYAKERNVGIRLWVHWKPLSQQLEPAFTQYEAWGVTGLMVDFLDRDDQEMIDFSERVLESAARHKLNIQFHGSSKYSGEQRTYPNLVNREGVLNLEYLKWSALCDPAHNVNVAYTRALAGPIDYHHGGFRSVSRATFRPEMLSPVVLGTRCHHLALYLTYENPVPMLADRPEHYENQPGFDFLCQLPTTWDETRYVAGETGEYLVLARRRGADWYLGGITNWTPRTLEVPMSFLGQSTYEAKLLVDGSLDEDHPNEIKERTAQVTPSSSLQIQLAPGGGFVGKLSPR
jgi:alpha-glucosidase